MQILTTTKVYTVSMLTEVQGGQVTCLRSHGQEDNSVGI